MKKLFLFSMMCLMASPFFTGCEKDTESNGNGGNTEPQNHNKVLTFSRSDIKHIHPDTIRYYLNQPDIDSVLMQSEDPEMCCHMSPDQADNVVQILQGRCDISPRVAGTGDLFFATDAYQSTVDQARRLGFNARYSGTKKR